MSENEGNRRPAGVVDRDKAIGQALTVGAKSLVDLSTELGIEKNQAYGSVWRLRRDGLVEKANTGSRTPVWQLTVAGADAYQVPLPPRAVAAAPSPQAPAPEAPAPEVPPAPQPEMPVG